MRSEIVDIECDVLGETEKAIRIRDHNTGKVVWLPLSQVEVSDEHFVTIPRWLAEEKGLV